MTDEQTNFRGTFNNLARQAERLRITGIDQLIGRTICDAVTLIDPDSSSDKPKTIDYVRIDTGQWMKLPFNIGDALHLSYNDQALVALVKIGIIQRDEWIAYCEVARQNAIKDWDMNIARLNLVIAQHWVERSPSSAPVVPASLAP